MAPLLLCGFGLIFVLLRVTANDVDVVPDTIGLALYAIGLWRLSSTSRLLIIASALAGFAAVAALADFAPDLLSEDLEDGLGFTRSISVALAVTAGAWGLRGIAVRHQDRIHRALAVVTVVTLAGLGLFVGGWAVNPADHDLAVSLIGWSRVATAVGITVYVVVLVLAAGRDWAQAPESRTAATR